MGGIVSPNSLLSQPENSSVKKITNMKVYPNPARSLAYVSIPAELKKGGNLIIRNNSGEIIEERIFSENDAQIISLDFSGQPNGLYNVALDDGISEVSADLLNLVASDNSALV